MDRLLEKRKLLMLSAKDSEVQFILAAQNMGYHVITTGYKADRPGNRFADEYIPFDFSDYAGLASLAKDLKIDALCQGCNDHCALAASAIGGQLGLRGHDSLEVATILHRKDKFKDFAKRVGLTSPLSEHFSSIEEALARKDALPLPLIVKPSDLAGGVGVSVVFTIAEYAEAIKEAFDAGHDGCVIVEPFIQGTVHSLTALLVDRKVILYATADDYSFQNEYLTNTGKFPASNHDAAVAALIPEIELVADSLELVDGLLHLQYMADEAGRFWIIEMMRRSPGNCYLSALSEHTGVDWLKWILRAEAGEDISWIANADVDRLPVAYHSIMASENGTIDKIVVDEETAAYVSDYVEWMQPGSIINDHLNQKAGAVLLHFMDEAECEEVLSTINSRIRVLMEEPGTGRGV